MASLNLRLAREMQTVFPVHTAFCLCHGWDEPPEMLPRLSDTAAIHSPPAAFAGLFPNDTCFAVASDQLYPLAVGFGLWPRKYHLGWLSPEEPSLPAWPHSICGMTSCRGSPGGMGTQRQVTRGWQGSSQAAGGGSYEELSSTARNHFLFQNKYPNLALFRNNYSAFSSLPGLIQSYLRAGLLQCLQAVFFSIYGSSPNRP